MPSPDDQRLWTLDRFDSSFGSWVDRERPSPELQGTVAEWIQTRRLNPQEGAQLRADVDGLWFARIRYTSDGHTVVSCSYFVDAPTRVVRCVLLGSIPCL